MKTEKKSVADIRKLTDAEIGKIYRKTGEIIRRVNDGTISFEGSLEVIQKIIIEGKLAKYLDVANGLAEITYSKHLIDCDAKPVIPKGFTLVEHKKGGHWEWNPDIHFYLSENQKKGTYSIGNDLRKELDNQSVLNANVLNYLLAHPGLIPKRWRDEMVFFWNTIYCRDSDTNLYVRCLYWNGAKWDWRFYQLDNEFYSNFQAALVS